MVPYNPDYPNRLKLGHGSLEFPVFMPDATFGYIRSLDSADLENCKIEAVVMNTFHLMQHPGSTVVQSLGGLHSMAGWDRPIITDSGGFQAYSLIRQNSKYGQIQDKGLIFQPEGSDRKMQLTPEKSVQLQMSFGTDAVICLDDCTHVDASREEQQLSVNRTIAWAKRSKREFDKIAGQKNYQGREIPQIFAVIQGGGEKDLRLECAQALLEIGFDGFGFGGWPLDGEGELLLDILAYTRSVVPANYPIHALGIGHPKNIEACYRMGYGIFDCAMPTRDARHGRLYSFTQPAKSPGSGLEGNWLKYVYIGDERQIRANKPVSEGCDCLCCTRYSLAYLRHLFKQNDSLYLRLASIHNLRFMTELCNRLRTIHNG
jgi:queuine tRNA-ribosyltransferase